MYNSVNQANHLISAAHTAAGFLPAWQQYVSAQQGEEAEVSFLIMFVRCNLAVRLQSFHFLADSNIAVTFPTIKNDRSDIIQFDVFFRHLLLAQYGHIKTS